MNLTSQKARKFSYKSNYAFIESIFSNIKVYIFHNTREVKAQRINDVKFRTNKNNESSCTARALIEAFPQEGFCRARARVQI